MRRVLGTIGLFLVITLITFVAARAVPEGREEGPLARAGIEERALLEGAARPAFVQLEPWDRDRFGRFLVEELRAQVRRLEAGLSQSLARVTPRWSPAQRSAALDRIWDRLGSGWPAGSATTPRLLALDTADRGDQAAFLESARHWAPTMGKILARCATLRRLGSMGFDALSARAPDGPSSPRLAALEATLKAALSAPTEGSQPRDAGEWVERWRRAAQPLLDARQAERDALQILREARGGAAETGLATVQAARATRRRAEAAWDRETELLGPSLARWSPQIMPVFLEAEPAFLVLSWPLLEASLACPLARPADPRAGLRVQDDADAIRGRLARWWRLAEPHFAAPRGWPDRAWASLSETGWGAWLRDLLSGDLGTSHRPPHRRVGEEIGRVWPVSFALGGLAFLLLCALAIPLGLWMGAHHTRPLVRRLRRGLDLLYVTPSFWLGSLLILALAGRWPVQGLHSREVANALRDGSLDPWSISAMADGLAHLFLPASVLALPALPVLTNYLAAEVARLMTQDFVVLARSRGLSPFCLWRSHLLRPAALPLISQLPAILSALLGGSVLIEVLFGLPGLGRLAWDAATERDLPLVMGMAVLSAVIVLVSFTIADLLARAIDPRGALREREG